MGLYLREMVRQGESRPEEPGKNPAVSPKLENTDRFSVRGSNPGPPTLAISPLGHNEPALTH